MENLDQHEIITTQELEVTQDTALGWSESKE